MNILALDQASQTSGYAIFKDNDLINFGTFTFEDKDIGKRLTNIKYKIESLIKEFNIDYVVFEEIQLQENVGNNVVTFKTLSKVMGVLQQLLYELKIENSCYFSTTWKANLNIKGNNRDQQKQNALEYVAKNYKVIPPQDAADAICIGTHHIKTLTETFDWSD